ncbi:hypothetical protein GUJ93_ZPchr0007g4137 [Zizania palustris]|uniref:Uncharacterized protein n=1 Tax=Zizania palustris TaxID=103762 RepID=A0A8J5TEN0_ZIZPA|nr:hypothetical protein GUJ93_ZPchr0007g4137 [Zizania palustris]
MFQRSDAMITFVPTVEDMQALADLQQAVANLRAYLGLAPVASTLSSFPYDVTSFLTTPSPHAEAKAQGGRKDREVLSPILIKEATDQQGEVTLMALVEPSADDAALTANKSAMEQVVTASSPSSPNMEAEAQGGGEKGGDATNQTLPWPNFHSLYHGPPPPMRRALDVKVKATATPTNHMGVISTPTGQRRPSASIVLPCAPPILPTCRPTYHCARHTSGSAQQTTVELLTIVVGLFRHNHWPKHSPRTAPSAGAVAVETERLARF